MKTQSTPGPWRLSFHCYGEVANIHSGDTPLLGFTLKPDDAEMIANARLIASAPELLEALEMAIEWSKEVPSPYREFPFITAALTAIAKAKGEAK